MGLVNSEKPRDAHHGGGVCCALAPQLVIIVIMIVVVIALVAEEFLSTSASQLTYHGLCELSATLKDEQLCVLFRNNHFSTLYKHKVA